MKSVKTEILSLALRPDLLVPNSEVTNRVWILVERRFNIGVRSRIDLSVCIPIKVLMYERC